MKGLQGKVAVVTGGSSGIGQAIAIRLGQEGVDVAINYVGRPEGAEATRETIEHGVDICMKQMSEAGTDPVLVEADVSDADQVARMFEQVHDKYGRLDILINNAGNIRWAGMPEVDQENLQLHLAVHLGGSFNTTRAAWR